MWDDFRDNCSELKSSYPEMLALTDTHIRNAQPSAGPVRLDDDRGLYLESQPKRRQVVAVQVQL